METSPYQKLYQKASQGSNQISSLLREKEELELRDCMQSNIDNMEGFVSCGKRAEDRATSLIRDLEAKMMFINIKSQDCLNRKDFAICEKEVESNLHRIYQEYRNINN